MVAVAELVEVLLEVVPVAVLVLLALVVVVVLLMLLVVVPVVDVEDVQVLLVLVLVSVPVKVSVLLVQVRDVVVSSVQHESSTSHASFTVSPGGLCPELSKLGGLRT